MCVVLRCVIMSCLLCPGSASRCCAVVCLNPHLIPLTAPLLLFFYRSKCEHPLSPPYQPPHSFEPPPLLYYSHSLCTFLSILIHLCFRSPSINTSRNTSSLSVDIFSKVDSEEIKIAPSKLERGHSSRSGERSVRTLLFFHLVEYDLIDTSLFPHIISCTVCYIA